MKIGINLYLWLTRLEPRHYPLLAKLRASGFVGVEVPTGDYSASELQSIRSELSNNGLRCTLATLLPRGYSPISLSAQERQSAFEQIRRDIDVAAAIGAEYLVGPIHSAHKVFSGKGPVDTEFDYCVDFLHQTGMLAKDAGIHLAIEPLNRFECYFLNTAEQAKRLSAAVSLDNVGILYDTHHANIEESDIGTAICSLGNHLNHFHVSESHRGTPGTGTVDWVTTFKALQAINYQGWYVIEAFGTNVPGIPEAVNIWRDCYSSEEEVYQKGFELIGSLLDAYPRLQ